MRRGVHGFTLLEAMAAVVTLGLLAAAVVPLLRNFGQLARSERLLAQGYLRTMTPPDGLIAGTTLPIPGQPGWRLTVSELIPEAEPPGRVPPTGPAHRWLLLGIEADNGADRLAETVVAVIDPP
jgi:hypothetical protein